MFAPRVTLRKGARDEAEKPFWISFADLMTALMVLFLVVMIVALVAVRAQSAELAEKTRRVEEQRQFIDAGKKAGEEAQRQEELEARKREFEERLARALPDGVRIDFDTHRINLGASAFFGNAESSLTPSEERKLRLVAKALVNRYRASGRGLLNRVDIEGFASKRGRFLSNLALSLARSERMMCAVLTNDRRVANRLALPDQKLAAQLFAIGGRSSNDLKSSEAASRRIELALQYVSRLGQKTAPELGVAPFVTAAELGTCPLGP